MAPKLVVSREPDARGLHVHTSTASLSLCRMAASASWRLRLFRGWCDAGVELRLGRFLLAVSWDYEHPDPLHRAWTQPIMRELTRKWSDEQEAAYKAGATEGAPDA